LALQDSITEENIREMRAAKVANNRLFYHVIIEDVGSFIQVLDLSTNTIIDSIEVPLCRQLVYLDEDRLLVVLDNGYFILFTESLETTETETPGFGNDPVTYNAKDGVLYVLRSNAQPAVVPYTLSKVNLSTGQSFPLSKAGEWIEGPIVYDSKTNVIISGGGLKIFSTGGDLLKNVNLPHNALHIFVN
jgi:hypothetical protein